MIMERILKDTEINHASYMGEMGGGERGPTERGAIYNYDRFMLLYGRNQHNIVKQVSSNHKINFKKA